MARRGLTFLNLLYVLPLGAIALVCAIALQVDVVVGNGLASVAALLPVKVLRPRVRIALGFHAYVAGLGPRWIRVIRSWCRGVDVAVANSVGNAEDLSLVMPKGKIVRVEHWADPCFFAVPIPSTRTTPPLHVLYVGRLDPEKFGQCQRVCCALAEEGVVELQAVGTGSMQDRVHWTAAVSNCGYIGGRAELARKFGWADVTWAPADTTYLSRPGIESLASAVPVLVSDIPVDAQRRGGDIRIPRDLVSKSVGWVVDGLVDTEVIGLLRVVAAEGIPREMREAARKVAVEGHGEARRREALAALMGWGGSEAV